ncbi:MAG: aspartate/glutamate racemase family protein [Rhodobacterales bacterium]|nr:aspartate/glutamate racemase family protein [Rhodobacterales bacterium]
MTEHAPPPHTFRGGKTIYGASVGVLMLETRFPRVVGDMGNAATWPFPVHYEVVPGASPDRVVRRQAEGLRDDFIAAAQRLVARGADGITTTCGFLALFQDDLAAACGVPVAASSLMQAPWVQAMLPPGQRVGIITISKNSIRDTHLAAAKVPEGTPIVGTDGGREFTTAILDDHPTLDVAASRLDILDAGHALVSGHPDVGAIVLECANMAPHAPALREAFGRPVYSIYSLVTWFQAGLMPRRFDVDLVDTRPSGWG